MKKKLLMITWRDIKSPFTGGAENLTHGILKQLRKKYTITVLTSAFPHCKIKENIDGIQYIRLGSRQFNYVGVYNWRVYFSVLRYWFLHIRNKQNYDVVIEQINNIPFLYPLYGGKKTIIYINQLCRINWFYQVPLMLSCIGFLIFEPLYLWLLRKQKVITISKSSKNDLVRFGFDKKNIHIIHVGIEFKPVTSLDRIKKFKHFSILSIGNIRSMKRTHDQIEAFEKVKSKIPMLKLYIAGLPSGSYGGKVFDMINRSIYKNDIIYLGHVSHKNKKKLMQQCHCVLVTSTKEGWGLIVTEAGSQGTPSIVYNVDGLRDSVQNGKAGYLCLHNNPDELAKAIYELFSNENMYKDLQKKAWEFSKQYTYQRSYQDYIKAIEYVS